MRNEHDEFKPPKFKGIFLFTLLLCAAVAGCRQNGTGVAADSPSGNAADAPRANGNSAVAKPTPAMAAGQTFKGNVNEIPVTARLVIKDGQISGTYQYDKVGKDIPLKGTVGKDNKLTMEEFADGADKPATASFAGEMSDAYAPVLQLNGDWTKKGGKDALFFILQALNLEDGFQVAPKTLDDKAKNYEIAIIYPEFSGGNNPNLSKLNEEIRRTVEATVKKFKADEFLKEGNNNSLNGSYSVPLLNNEIASVDYSDYTYLGGAHGSPASHPVNYDLKNGRGLALADLFKPQENYLKFISDYCIAELNKREGIKDDPATIKEGAAPKAENYQDWYLSRKGLVIGFEPYQVAAYALGSPHVIIPFSALTQILKPDGAAASLLK